MDELGAELDIRCQRGDVQDVDGLSGILCQSTTVPCRRLRHVVVAVSGALQRGKPTAVGHWRRQWSHSIHRH